MKLRVAGILLIAGLVALGDPTPSDARRRRRSSKKSVRKKKKARKKKRRRKAKPRPAARPDPPRRGPGYRKARQLFKEGIGLFDQGYYIQAVGKFKEAQKHFPSVKIHARIALCYKWLGNHLKALEHYEAFLQGTPENPKQRKDVVLRKQVSMEVKTLLALIGQISVAIEKPAGAKIRLNGRLVGKAPFRRLFRLKPGQVTVTAMAKGYYAASRSVKLLPSQKVKLQLGLIKIKPKVVRKIVRIRATPIYKRWWFWTIIGTVVAGGAAGLGVGLGIKTEKRNPTGDVVFRQNTLGARW